MIIRLNNADMPIMARVKRAFPGAEVLVGIDRTNVQGPNAFECDLAIAILAKIQRRARTRKGATVAPAV